MIGKWLEIEKALARCQAELGLIPDAASHAIQKISFNDLDQTMMAEDMLLVGRPIVGLVRQMRELVPDHAAHVHFNATTQDIMDTGLALQIKAGLEDIHQNVAVLVSNLTAQRDAHRHTKILARTNGQHAVPMDLRVKLDVWITELTRRLEALDQASERGLNVQVGGPAGDLSNYNPQDAQAAKRCLCKALQLGSIEPHWQNARDGLADIIASLGILCASLQKISYNINLLCSSDIAEASEYHTDRRGASSSMSHKKNQRASEFGEAVARLGRQRAAQMPEHMMHQHERSGGVWIGEWIVIPEVFLLTSGALQWANEMISGLTFDASAMQSTIDRFEATLRNDV